VTWRGVKGTQNFYRSFYYPGNGHCGGNTGYPNAGLINANDLSNSLIAWVENGNPPISVVAYTAANDTGNTTLICSNPNQTVYNGGSITSASSYNYQLAPGASGLVGYDQTAIQYCEAP
jgi:hypothetical protein